MPPRSTAVQWDWAEPAPVVLISGPEDLLADRAVETITRAVRAQDPEVAVLSVDAGPTYQPGGLALAASPSLFAEQAVVVVDRVAEAGEDFTADAVAYVADPAPSAVVVFRHGGGVRGKKVLDTIRKAGHPEVSCAAITRDADKHQFAVGEFRRAERTIEPEGLRLLLSSVGGDLRELASACSQLVADTTGRITADQVKRYYGGRVETTVFEIADAALTGRTGRALSLARHALAIGVTPVAIVAAIGSKLRAIAKVGGASRRGLDPVKDLGLAPYAVTQARKEVPRWDAERLGAAIRAVAEADAGVKGAVRDPRYALDKAIVAVSRAANR